MASLPVQAAELVLDFMRGGPLPSGAAAREEAKGLVCMALAQRTDRKVFALLLAAQLWAGGLVEELVLIEGVLSSVPDLQEGSVAERVQELALLRRLDQAVLINLLNRHPELLAEALRLQTEVRELIEAEVEE